MFEFRTLFERLLPFRLSYYLQDSRNLKKQTDKQKRFKLLHQGKLDIVSFLSKFPKTTHDPNSYLIDMPVAVVKLAI